MSVPSAGGICWVATNHDADLMDAEGQVAAVSLVHTARARQMMAIIATGDGVSAADTAVPHITPAFDQRTIARFGCGEKDDLRVPYDIACGMFSTAVSLFSSNA